MFSLENVFVENNDIPVLSGIGIVACSTNQPLKLC